MERLTNKNEIEMYKSIDACRYKLCQLEDIEQELGIELTTLFKAIKNGIWYLDDNEVPIFIEPRNLNINGVLFESIIDRASFIIDIPDDLFVDEVPFTDYGKTWALTKEELDK